MFMFQPLLQTVGMCMCVCACVRCRWCTTRGERGEVSAFAQDRSTASLGRSGCFRAGSLVLTHSRSFVFCEKGDDCAGRGGKRQSL